MKVEAVFVDARGIVCQAPIRRAGSDSCGAEAIHHDDTHRAVVWATRTRGSLRAN